jgi:hypothetical protein
MNFVLVVMTVSFKAVERSSYLVEVFLAVVVVLMDDLSSWRLPLDVLVTITGIGLGFLRGDMTVRFEKPFSRPFWGVAEGAIVWLVSWEYLSSGYEAGLDRLDVLLSEKHEHHSNRLWDEKNTKRTLGYLKARSSVGEMHLLRGFIRRPNMLNQDKHPQQHSRLVRLGPRGLGVFEETLGRHIHTYEKTPTPSQKQLQ